MIEEVLEHYGADRVGPNMRCPFHDDAHQSASVTNDLFYCFTCGKGGDAIALIRWREDCGYAEAVRIAEGIVGEGHAEVRGGTAGESGYGLPHRPRADRKRRKYVPAWLRQ